MQAVVPRAILASVLIVFPLLIGCSNPDPERDRAAVKPAEAAPAPEAAPASRPPAAVRKDLENAPRIIILGDSLTAGLGLPPEQSFPSVIQERLDKAGERYLVSNAGVSGDTSAGGLRRLEFAMSEGEAKALVVALGGNDGLRGLPPEQLQQNLATIIERAQEKGLRVVLAGMEAPPNFGADYTARFRGVYTALAEKYKVRLLPFLLDGVAGNPALNQADGIHPNARGAAIVADLVWRALEPELALLRTTTTR
jgi:acyl-CoA thioesterase-1